jgi:hypothetical protein
MVYSTAKEDGKAGTGEVISRIIWEKDDTRAGNGEFRVPRPLHIFFIK